MSGLDTSTVKGKEARASEFYINCNAIWTSRSKFGIRDDAVSETFILICHRNSAVRDLTTLQRGSGDDQQVHTGTLPIMRIFETANTCHINFFGSLNLVKQPLRFPCIVTAHFLSLKSSFQLSADICQEIYALEQGRCVPLPLWLEIMRTTTGRSIFLPATAICSSEI
jgi:hypothetical protein